MEPCGSIDTLSRIVVKQNLNLMISIAKEIIDNLSDLVRMQEAISKPNFLLGSNENLAIEERDIVI